MNELICKFCGAMGPLCRSHIIPEFLFAPTYDKQGRFISVSSHPRHPVRPMQSGFWERLLCRDCEQRFSKYETASASVLNAIYDYPARGDYIDVEGCDQGALRLLSLSILWRAHVSTLHQFAQVSLGPYAAKIHTMLSANHPGTPFDVAVLLMRFRGGGVEDRLVVPPTRKRFAGLYAYEMIALGLRWVFFTSAGTEALLPDFPFVGSRPDLRVTISDVDSRETPRRLRRLAVKWKKT